VSVAARVLCVWVALVSVATPAAAESGFVWVAPAPCPDALQVSARIERRLGMPVDGSVHGIAVAIERVPTGFVARIDTRGVTVANQIRTLISARCDELADAVAVVVARLATEAAAHERAVRSAAVAEDNRDDELPSVVRARPTPTTWRDAGPWGGGLRALALSGVGTLPGVGIGGDLGAFVRRRDVFAEVGVARWASSPRYLVEGAPGGVEVRLDTLALRGGWSPQRMPIRGWLGLELGRITGRGLGLIDSQSASTRWVAGVGGFGVAWPMARLVRLVGTFEVAVPLQQTRFILSDGQQIYRPSPAAARCAFGIEVGWR
jgi:hypothetical protein